MATEQDRILIVESDPLISDLVGRQTLQAAGYEVAIISDANSAISEAVEFAPDVIIANLSLPGLSGNDLLVALNAQDITTPVILLAKKGLESEIIQSIRLGAADYLILPARETEILTVVERILKRVHAERQREQLIIQQHTVIQEMQQQLEIFAALLKVGKDVTAITDQGTLVAKITDHISQMLQADMAWMLLKEESSKAFILAAQRNLPASLPIQLNQPWDDGISQLVALSGEQLALNGERLKRYKVSSFCQSILILPLKIAGKVAGMLALVRIENQPFTENEQSLALSVIDFASIALSNVRIIRSIGDRARQQEQLTAVSLTNERIASELLQKVKNELHSLLATQETALSNIVENLTRQMSQYQRDQFEQLQESLADLVTLTKDIVPLKPSRSQRSSRPVNLNDLVRNIATRFQPFTQSKEISLTTDLPDELVFIKVDEEWLYQAIGGVVSNAIKYCAGGGNINLSISPPKDDLAHLIVTDSGPAIESEMLGKIFSGAHSAQILPQRQGGLGISMPLIQDIINRINGKIWVENKPGQGVQFHIVIPTQ